MAALLIVGVVVVLVLLYTADRVRKARSRARLLHAMNDRLTVAAAQIDQEQERRQAVARASAELTSVMPAIKRPPLTLPGVAGHEPGPPEDSQAAGDEQAAGGGQPAQAAAGQPAAVRPLTGEPAAGEPGAEEPVADEPEPDEPGAEEPGAAPAPEADGDPAGRPAEHTLTLPGLEPGGDPGRPLRRTGEGTLIMSPVPAPPGGQAAGPDAPPAPEETAGRAGGQPGPHRRPHQRSNPAEPAGS